MKKNDLLKLKENHIKTWDEIVYELKKRLDEIKEDIALMELMVAFAKKTLEDEIKTDCF